MVSAIKKKLIHYDIHKVLPYALWNFGNYTLNTERVKS